MMPRAKISTQPAGRLRNNHLENEPMKLIAWPLFDNTIVSAVLRGMDNSASQVSRANHSPARCAATLVPFLAEPSSPSGGLDLAGWIWSGGFHQVDLVDSAKESSTPRS